MKRKHHKKIVAVIWNDNWRIHQVGIGFNCQNTNFSKILLELDTMEEIWSVAYSNPEYINIKDITK